MKKKTSQPRVGGKFAKKQPLKESPMVSASGGAVNTEPIAERSNTSEYMRYTIQYRIVVVGHGARNKLFAGVPIDKGWHEVKFKSSLTEPTNILHIDCPIDEREFADMGYTLSYETAEAARWYFTAKCKNMGLSIDTRLVRKRVLVSLRVEDQGPDAAVPHEKTSWDGQLPEQIAKYANERMKK